MSLVQQRKTSYLLQQCHPSELSFLLIRPSERPLSSPADDDDDDSGAANMSMLR